MNILYFFTGVGAACIVLSLLLFILIYRYNRRNMGLPENLANNIGYMWEKHPTLLMNLEDILRQWNETVQEKLNGEEERNERIESNRLFESTHLAGQTMPEYIGISVEGFAIKTFLTRHYPGERSLLMEACLQRICNKIARKLEPEEMELIYQLDRKYWAAELDLLLEQDSEVTTTMDEFERILQRKNNSGTGQEPPATETGK